MLFGSSFPCRNGFILLRLLSASILLSGAVAKGLSLAGMGKYALASGNVSWEVLPIVFETVFGLWVLRGWWPRGIWWSSLFVWASLSIISLVKILQGHDSCGCFGAVSIHPSVMLFTDMSVFLAFVVFPPRRAAQESGSQERLAVGVLFVTLMSTGAALSFRQQAIETIPANWIDQPFPLISQIASGQDLADGAWIVVLYRKDCTKCRSFIANFERSWNGEGDQRAVLLEIGDSKPTPVATSRVQHRSLRHPLPHTTSVPIVVYLEDGIVVQLDAPRDLDAGVVSVNSRGAT
jgi:hypothetical protein